MSAPASPDRRQLLQALSLAGIGLAGLSTVKASTYAPGAGVEEQGFVNTSFGAVYYRHTGTGPHLLLIHQSAQSSQEFVTALPFLTSSFRVTVIDLPGHGLSDTPPRELSMQEYTDAIIEVLRHLDIGKTHVVGNHGGAILAVDLATRYKDFTDRLVLCGLGRGEELDIEALINTPMTRDLPVDKDGQFLARTWQVYRNMSASKTPPEVTFQPFLVSLQQRLRPYDMHHAAYRWDYMDVMHKLDRPSLFLKAEEDLFAGDTESLAAKVKDGRYQTIADGGVWVFYEQAERCSEIIKKFCTT